MPRDMKFVLRSTGYKFIVAMPFPYTMKLQLLYNIYPECSKIVFTSDSVIQNDMSRLKPVDMPAIRPWLF